MLQSPKISPLQFCVAHRVCLFLIDWSVTLVAEPAIAKEPFDPAHEPFVITGGIWAVRSETLRKSPSCTGWCMAEQVMPARLVGHGRAISNRALNWRFLFRRNWETATRHCQSLYRFVQCWRNIGRPRMSVARCDSVLLMRSKYCADPQTLRLLVA